MKYRIEPKPERKLRFRPLLETEDLGAVKAWIANPPVPVTTHIRGTDGTYHQLATPSYHDIVVSVFAPDTAMMRDNGHIPCRWMPCGEVSTVASMETEEGCRQIEVWNGEPVGTRKPRAGDDR